MQGNDSIVSSRPYTQERELRKASIYKAFKDLIKQFATILQQNRA